MDTFYVSLNIIHAENMRRTINYCNTFIKLNAFHVIAQFLFSNVLYILYYIIEIVIRKSITIISVELMSNLTSISMCNITIFIWLSCDILVITYYYK